ncbi:AI-2E family transporter [Phenylobacterium immobile]|uniref:AI-2E family transporter n=1 Tax=Phenylobacterium immobile TaxID=21 RepID=UPI000A44CA09|nr:AI-2E family transporter [Phenylobacterium immobile]
MPVTSAPLKSDAVTRTAVVILAVIAGGAALRWLADILTPLALAAFLAVMIDGFARVLRQRLPLPPRAALPLAVILSLILFGGTAVFIADNAAAFASQVSGYMPRMNQVLARVAGLVGVDVPPTVNQLVHMLDPARSFGMIASWLQSFTSTAAFTLVYLGFILAARAGWKRKMIGMFPEKARRHEAVETFARIRDGVERYLWVQTVTGLMITGVSYLVMLAVGLDNAAFWAFLIFIASYIPVIGGVIGVAAPPLFALLQFPTYWQAFTLLAVLYGVTTVVGNIIYPRMQGRSLNMDPVAVLLALAFWGAIWGVTGAFLSTPLAVMVMVILAQFEGTRWIAVLLSADGEPNQLKSRAGLTPPGHEPPESETKPKATSRTLRPRQTNAGKTTAEK